MNFVTFDGFDFNFNMLPHTRFTLYRPVNDIDDSGTPITGFDNGTKISEPLVSSNYNNISFSNQTGGNVRTETNAWWSHIANVPKGSKLVCDDGRKFMTTNQGRSDVIPSSFYYALKEVDNDDGSRTTSIRSESD